MVVIIKAIKQKKNKNTTLPEQNYNKRSDHLTKWSITHLHRIISISSHSSLSAFKENLLNNAGKQKKIKTMKAHQQNEPQTVSGSVP